MMYLFLIPIAYISILLVRNFFVLEERLRMNELIFRQDNWHHLLNKNIDVSYDSMVLKFWVWPISKMWPKELQELK